MPLALSRSAHTGACATPQGSLAIVTNSVCGQAIPLLSVRPSFWKMPHVPVSGVDTAAGAREEGGGKGAGAGAVSRCGRRAGTHDT